MILKKSIETCVQFINKCPTVFCHIRKKNLARFTYMYIFPITIELSTFEIKMADTPQQVH